MSHKYEGKESHLDEADEVPGAFPAVFANPAPLEQEDPILATFTRFETITNGERVLLLDDLQKAINELMGEHVALEMVEKHMNEFDVRPFATYGTYNAPTDGVKKNGLFLEEFYKFFEAVDKITRLHEPYAGPPFTDWSYDQLEKDPKLTGQVIREMQTAITHIYSMCKEMHMLTVKWHDRREDLQKWMKAQDEWYKWKRDWGREWLSPDSPLPPPFYQTTNPPVVEKKFPQYPEGHPQPAFIRVVKRIIERFGNVELFLLSFDQNEEHLHKDPTFHALAAIGIHHEDIDQLFVHLNLNQVGFVTKNEMRQFVNKVLAEIMQMNSFGLQPKGVEFWMPPVSAFGLNPFGNPTNLVGSPTPPNPMQKEINSVLKAMGTVDVKSLIDQLTLHSEGTMAYDIFERMITTFKPSLGGTAVDQLWQLCDTKKQGVISFEQFSAIFKKVGERSAYEKGSEEDAIKRREERRAQRAADRAAAEEERVKAEQSRLEEEEAALSEQQLHDDDCIRDLSSHLLRGGSTIASEWYKITTDNDTMDEDEWIQFIARVAPRTLKSNLDYHTKMRLFQRMDVNQNGSIDLNEFAYFFGVSDQLDESEELMLERISQAVKRSSYEDIKHYFDHHCLTKNEMSFHDFWALLRNFLQHTTENQAMSLFMMIDSVHRRSNSISWQEFSKVFKVEKPRPKSEQDLIDRVHDSLKDVSGTLYDAFMRFTSNKQYMDINAFRRMMTANCNDLTPPQVMKLFAEVDKDNSGSIDFDEFALAFGFHHHIGPYLQQLITHIGQKINSSEMGFRKTFEGISDGREGIERHLFEKLVRVFDKRVKSSTIASLFDHIDKLHSRDGIIDYQEFCAAFKVAASSAKEDVALPSSDLLSAGDKSVGPASVRDPSRSKNPRISSEVGNVLELRPSSKDINDLRKSGALPVQSKHLQDTEFVDRMSKAIQKVCNQRNTTLKAIFESVTQGRPSMTDKEFLKLLNVFDRAPNPEQVMRLWENFDANNDGGISYDEFSAVFHQSVQRQNAVPRMGNSSPLRYDSNLDPNQNWAREIVYHIALAIKHSGKPHRYWFGPAVGAEKTKFMSKEAFFKLINLFFSTEDYSLEQLTLIWDHKVSDTAKKNGLELAEFSRIFADPTPSEERPNSTN